MLRYMGQKDDPRIDAERIRRLYMTSPLASGGAICAALILAAILIGSQPVRNIAVWVCAAVLATLTRLFFVIWFQKQGDPSENPRFWKNLFNILIFISGITWGAAGIFLFPEKNVTGQIGLICILIGMTAGAVSTFSAYKSTFVAYTFPAILPLAANLLAKNTPLFNTLGGIILVYLAFVTLIAFYITDQTRSLIRLKYENTDLIEGLERAKEQAEKTNMELKLEMAQRKKIEDALFLHKKNLEAEIARRTAELTRANQELRLEIAERKRAEQALRESEEKYRILVENSSEGICILKNNKISFANQRFCELLGISYPLASANIPIEGFFSPDNRNKAMAFLSSDTSRNPLTHEPVFRATRSDGTEIWVMLTRVMVPWEGEDSIMCLLRDVTRQKELEVQLIQAQKMESIGSLASGIAHDINNVLGGISGIVSLLLMNLPADSPMNQKIKDIESYIEKGARLTSQLLEFAQPDLPRIVPVDINGHLAETLEIYGRTHKEIIIHASYDAAPAAAEVDPQQMEQVYLNLLVNAWHAMPGGGEIFVRTENIEISDFEAGMFQVVPGSYIKISFTDTGCGMDESIISKIFDPFFTTKEKKGGTGLGLSTVYTIIKNHGGHITVYSKPGHGSTFNIYLPATRKAAIEEPREEDHLEKGEETILLIDDEADILEIGCEMLSALGYKVLSADCGKAAIEIFKKEKENIDLIILDMIMPDMDGMRVFETLMRLKPTTKVLLSSGYSKSGQAQKLMEKGCHGFIQKPFNLHKLSTRIRKILDNKEGF